MSVYFNYILFFVSGVIAVYFALEQQWSKANFFFLVVLSVQLSVLTRQAREALLLFAKNKDDA